MSLCRSPSGERGLKLQFPRAHGRYHRRSPSGERGLKCFITVWTLLTGMSLPIRGAWIEISRTTNGGRQRHRRSPSGERGLKLHPIVYLLVVVLSLPIRGAWIEIKRSSNNTSISTSLPIRGAWIEILAMVVATPRGECRSPSGERGLKSTIAHPLSAVIRSLPIRGAWIEIARTPSNIALATVAPHPGSVD